MKKMIALIASLTVALAALAISPFGVSASTADSTVSDTATTTTTAVACYTTGIMPGHILMSVGQVRTVQVYHPVTGTSSGITVDSVSENIAVSYDENGSTIQITALAAGNATVYVCEKNCAFGAYVNIQVYDHADRAVVGDANNDYLVNMRDVLVTYQAVSGRTELRKDQIMGANYYWDCSLNMRDVLYLFQYVNSDVMMTESLPSISFKTLSFSDDFGAPSAQGGSVTVMRSVEEWNEQSTKRAVSSIKKQGFDFDEAYFADHALIVVESYAPREALGGTEVTKLSVSGNTLNVDALVTFRNGYTTMLYCGCLLLEVDAADVAEVTETAYRHNDAWLYGYSIVIDGVEL